MLYILLFRPTYRVSYVLDMWLQINQLSIEHIYVALTRTMRLSRNSFCWVMWPRTNCHPSTQPDSTSSQRCWFYTTQDTNLKVSGSLCALQIISDLAITKSVWHHVRFHISIGLDILNFSSSYYSSRAGYCLLSLWGVIDFTVQAVHKKDGTVCACQNINSFSCVAFKCIFGLMW